MITLNSSGVTVLTNRQTMWQTDTTETILPRYATLHGS